MLVRREPPTLTAPRAAAIEGAEARSAPGRAPGDRFAGTCTPLDGNPLPPSAHSASVAFGVGTHPRPGKRSRSTLWERSGTTESVDHARNRTVDRALRHVEVVSTDPAAHHESRSRTSVTPGNPRACRRPSRSRPATHAASHDADRGQRRQKRDNGRSVCRRWSIDRRRRRRSVHVVTRAEPSFGRHLMYGVPSARTPTM
jgi:hypothetical protein